MPCESKWIVNALIVSGWGLNKYRFDVPDAAKLFLPAECSHTNCGLQPQPRVAAASNAAFPSHLEAQFFYDPCFLPSISFWDFDWNTRSMQLNHTLRKWTTVANAYFTFIFFARFLPTIFAKLWLSTAKESLLDAKRKSHLSPIEISEIIQTNWSTNLYVYVYIFYYNSPFSTGSSVSTENNAKIFIESTLHQTPYFQTQINMVPR